jgi:hypothetical protein
MRRRAVDEKVEPFRARLHTAAGHALRDRLAAWAAGISRSGHTWPQLPQGIEDRSADVWEPLLSVADKVGGKWPKSAQSSAVALVALFTDYTNASLGLQLLADVRTVFGKSDWLPTAELLQKLHNLPESAWLDVGAKALTDRGLAVRLRDYGIKSKDIKIDAKANVVRKGYYQADFHDAWKRYLK